MQFVIQLQQICLTFSQTINFVHVKSITQPHGTCISTYTSVVTFLHQICSTPQIKALPFKISDLMISFFFIWLNWFRKSFHNTEFHKFVIHGINTFELNLCRNITTSYIDIYMHQHKTSYSIRIWSQSNQKHISHIQHQCIDSLNTYSFISSTWKTFKTS